MSTLPQYTSVTVAAEHNLIQLTNIAKLLGRGKGTVHMWMKRRRTSHFPMPRGLLRYGGKWIELYNMAEVVGWYADYVPSPGGAPLGNRNWVPKSQKTTS